MKTQTWFKAISPLKRWTFTALAIACAVLASPLFTFYGHEIAAGCFACFLTGYFTGASVHFKRSITIVLTIALLSIMPDPARAVFLQSGTNGVHAYAVAPVSSNNWQIVQVPLTPGQHPQPTHPITAPPPPPQPDNPGCLIAMVIIVAAFAYVVYCLIKFCQQHFSPPPNSPTNNVPSTNVSCAIIPLGLSPSINPPDTSSFNLTVLMSSNNATASTGTFVPVGSQLNWTDYTNALWTQYGLNATLASVGQGQSTPGFPYTVTVTNGAIAILEPGVPTQTVLVERTTDFTNWIPVVTNIVSMNITNLSTFDPDAPTDGAFYRTRILP